MKNRHALIIGLVTGAAVGAVHAWLMNLNPLMSTVAGILTFVLISSLNFTYMKLSGSVG